MAEYVGYQSASELCGDINSDDNDDNSNKTDKASNRARRKKNRAKLTGYTVPKQPYELVSTLPLSELTGSPDLQFALWTPEDVCAWVEPRLGARVKDLLQEAALEGADLVELEDSDLSDLVPEMKPGQRKRLLRKLEELKADNLLVRNVSRVLGVPAQRLLLKVPEVTREQLAQYRLIGAGHFGEVFHCVYDGVRDAAIKTAKLEALNVSALREARTMFLAEAAVLSKLQEHARHPNVVTLLGICRDFEATGFPYPVLTYHTQHSLSDFLELHAERLSSEWREQPAKLLHLMHGMARGLGHMHEHDLMHCDVAARNFLITSDGSPRLTDFGLARNVMSGRGIARAVPAGRYPPECFETGALSERAYTKTSDVWMLGTAFYEVVLRQEREPTTDGTHIVTEFSYQREELGEDSLQLEPAVETVVRDLLGEGTASQLVSGVITGCFMFDSFARFADAKEVAHAVEQAILQLDGESEAEVDSAEGEDESEAGEDESEAGEDESEAEPTGEDEPEAKPKSEEAEPSEMSAAAPAPKRHGKLTKEERRAEKERRLADKLRKKQEREARKLRKAAERALRKEQKPGKKHKKHKDKVHRRRTPGRRQKRLRLDASTSKLELSVPDKCRGIAVDPSTRQMYVTADDAVQVVAPSMEVVRTLGDLAGASGCAAVPSNEMYGAAAGCLIVGLYAKEGAVVCVQPEDGTERWRYNAHSCVQDVDVAYSARDGTGRVLVALQDCGFAVLDMNGQELTRVQTGGSGITKGLIKVLADRKQSGVRPRSLPVNTLQLGDAMDSTFLACVQGTFDQAALQELVEGDADDDAAASPLARFVKGLPERVTVRELDASTVFVQGTTSSGKPKTLRGTTVSSKSATRRNDFIRASELPNVATTVAYAKSRSSYFQVFEACDEGSLAQLLEQGSCSPTDLFDLLLDVATALVGLHHMRIAHGELRADNVLLRKRATAQRQRPWFAATAWRRKNESTPDTTASSSPLEAVLPPPVATGYDPANSKLVLANLADWHPCLAPEVLDGHLASPSRSSDVFMFGKLCLQVLGEDACPPRVLDVLRACLDAQPGKRPSISQVAIVLEHALVELQQDHGSVVRALNSLGATYGIASVRVPLKNEAGAQHLVAVACRHNFTVELYSLDGVLKGSFYCKSAGLMDGTDDGRLAVSCFRQGAQLFSLVAGPDTKHGKPDVGGASRITKTSTALCFDSNSELLVSTIDGELLRVHL